MSEEKKYIFHIDDTFESYWYVARSLGHAMELFLEDMQGTNLYEETEDALASQFKVSYERLKDDEPFTIDSDGEEVTRAAADWATESEFGELASTVYL